MFNENSRNNPATENSFSSETKNKSNLIIFNFQRMVNNSMIAKLRSPGKVEIPARTISTEIPFSVVGRKLKQGEDPLLINILRLLNGCCRLTEVSMEINDQKQNLVLVSTVMHGQTPSLLLPVTTNASKKKLMISIKRNHLQTFLLSAGIMNK